MRTAEGLLLRTIAAAKAADPLTRREREIAAMVANGMSNRAISQGLLLSERTVESHVRNILTKLGLSNRTEVATWTVRHEAG